MPLNELDLLNRRELQAVAKAHGIKANTKSEEILEGLREQQRCGSLQLLTRPPEAPLLAIAAAKSMIPAGRKRFGYAPPVPGEGTDGAAACSSVAFTPVDLVTEVNEAIGNLDEATRVMRLRATSPDGILKTSELQEVIKQLKGALAEQIKRGRHLGDVVVTKQQQIDHEMRRLADAATLQKAAAERNASELKLAQRRAEQAKASLAKRDVELAAALEELRALKASKVAAEDARKEAAEAAARLAPASPAELAASKVAQTPTYPW